MQDKTLSEIFEKDPDSYPESVIFQKGIVDYIEDIVWKEKPNKCFDKNRQNIENILNAHPSQKEEIRLLVEYEQENGKGSLRKFVEKEFEVPQYIKDFFGWKDTHLERQ